MEVKIYREPENESLLTNENELEQYRQLIKDLGMPEVSETKKPSVYQPLNSAMQKQIRALCPMNVNAFEYNYSTIPVEVLKVLDFCKTNEVFDGYQIWYDDKEPDPVLIGWTWMDEEAKQKDYSWKRHRALIARWGDCALEMPDLLQKGFDRIKVQLLDIANSSNNVSSNMIKDPDIYVRKILSGDSFSFLNDLSGNSGDFNSEIY